MIQEGGFAAAALKRAMERAELAELLYSTTDEWALDMADQIIALGYTKAPQLWGDANQVIPAEAVEAAALVLHTHGGLKVPEARERAQVILEAAAPHMLPGVWDEGHEEGWLNHDSGLTESQGRKRNPYRPTP